MRLIAWLASYLLFGLLLPVLLFHPKLRQGVRARFGLYPAGPRPWPPSRGGGPRLWLHGASAGDLLALLPILVELRRLRPDATLIVSTMTNSGHEIGRTRIAPHVDGVTFVPFDLPGATRRAMAVIRPDVLVLEYTEIWPNLIHAARAAGVRVALTNGRFAEDKMARYRWLHRLIGNPLERMQLLLMREPVEAERALALGAPRERVRVTGNTKFDNVAQAPDPEVVERLRAALGATEDTPLFVAGSTHEGEEKGVVAAYLAMRAVAPELRLLIAPRYPERAARVAAIARAEGLDCALRSERGPGPQPPTAVVVLDTIGELLAAYRLARLVFVGGSFVPRGGQNILEPAGQGRPVLFGPNMKNFRDSVEVLIGRGGIQVSTPEQLARVGAELLERPEELERLGAMARAAVQKVRGASRANAEALLALAGVTGPGS